MDDKRKMKIKRCDSGKADEIDNEIMNLFKELKATNDHVTVELIKQKIANLKEMKKTLLL